MMIFGDDFFSGDNSLMELWKIAHLKGKFSFMVEIVCRFKLFSLFDVLTL